MDTVSMCACHGSIKRNDVVLLSPCKCLGHEVNPRSGSWWAWDLLRRRKGQPFPPQGLRRCAVQGLSICVHAVHMPSTALPSARPCAAQRSPKIQTQTEASSTCPGEELFPKEGKETSFSHKQYFLSSFLNFGCTEWLAGSWFPNQGWHPCPLKGK